ncbi:long-chain-fatty-acid-CoA ligase [Rhizoclosmatium globosum]|uniref:Long-chain-fatty-acid-CoA ligase n=1 Tax=Rhizoclosmatium globosum TaxID=329046 RepID=A0A1Y2CGV3_9FUNG|nr:long-chain-fatty-acid-CoA ligase [Rhizoclosmatium globosum]|eukprot:ORY46054.1 long-chain-fatty-acid-CoA ligase [Rhizoclosmatium globosum]
MPQRSVEVPNTATATSGAIRRSILSPKELTARPAEGINTVYDILVSSGKKYANKDALGARRIVDTIKEQKEVTKKIPGGGEVKEMKTWTYFELSPYSWMTFGEVKSLALTYGSGLRALGLNPTDKMTVYAETSRDWMLMALSASTQNLTITTAYATLGEEGLLYSLQECEIAKSCPLVKNVIYNGAGDAAVLESLATQVKVLSLDELKALGEATPFEPVPPTAEDLACIMYTSGSTGPPKGVMLTHGNIVATVGGAYTFLKPYINGDEVILAFLPLAHILEMAVEMTFIFFGVSIGYGGVKTLTDSSVRNCKGDIRELRPHLLAGVPQIQASPPTVQKLFNTAYNLKWWLMSNGMGALAGPLDALIFNKIKDQVGGRLKLALSGGAPLPKSTQQFMNITSTTLVNGYGMTECSAVMSIQEPTMVTKLGILNGPTSALEAKLVDVPEMGYSSKNLPKPQGELWVRGGSVMKGYYKQPALTKEALTDDGWLMTGDIAEWNEDGTLQIIDRKKNLVKLANGEYVLFNPLTLTFEFLPLTFPFVQNICVHADSEKSYCVALIVPVEAQIRAVPEICARKEVRDKVLASLKDVAKSVGFKPAEVVGQVHLCHEEWTPQNGLLTAAMKLQRKQIVTKHKKELASYMEANPRVPTHI